eukprot:67834_1
MLFRYSTGSCEHELPDADHDEKECLTSSRSSGILDVDKVKRQLRHYIPCENAESQSSPDIVSRLYNSSLSFVNRRILRKFSKSERPFVFIIKVPLRHSHSPDGTTTCSPRASSKVDDNPPPVTVYSPKRSSTVSVLKSPCSRNSNFGGRLLNTMDDYFLERIETYAPVLQQMRESSGSSPVVFVTHWQNAESYPADWVVRFRNVVTKCLHHTPVYIESYGSDEETEDLLMDIVQDTMPDHLRKSQNLNPVRIKENRLTPPAQRLWPYAVIIMLVLIFVLRSSLLASNSTENDEVSGNLALQPNDQLSGLDKSLR